MRFLILLSLSFLFFTSCKDEKKNHPSNPEIVSTAEKIKYAKGFSITNYKNYTEIIVTSPWPGSQDAFRYLLVDNDEDIPEFRESAVIIKRPITKIVAMSTTNIPALEYLNVEDRLVGFPSTKYISSEKTRALIDNGHIKDLNNDLEINMELFLELQPDLVIGFSVNGINKSLNQIEKFGYPVVLDGSWTEEHPLGRAEWIKFIGALFNKQDEANAIFESIETDYLEAKALALKIKEKPVVLSGSMFNDVWNVPGGKSYIAKYFEDANTNYIWKDNTSNGSIQLNFENVLNRARQAEFWIGAGSFQSLEDMKNSHKGYSYFDAFKNKNIYTYTKKIGPKGGLLYYELGPLRPDLILKDIINISHPHLLKDYENYFFKRLD
ncbi:ABC transporter substrate-binding protein [Pseudotamlana carrageenivorans]|uniref:ABC transporter substrate-binding protein n=1 Tax=Pseudotamlana carrageenivorans TaxID=2069432 RepID=A0A2I7SE51_9FLAO|nr:ABC transporter substrate-binding protein [Tamlana carrageenivorans]AUS04179.1 ABC transporter substrate-binding protein [Tamlana carrageenivorans]